MSRNLNALNTTGMGVVVLWMIDRIHTNLTVQEEAEDKEKDSASTRTRA